MGRTARPDLRETRPPDPSPGAEARVATDPAVRDEAAVSAGATASRLLRVHDGRRVTHARTRAHAPASRASS